MWPPELMVISFPNNAVLMYNDRPYKGIRLGHSQTLSRQLKAAAHVYFIFLLYQGCRFITIFD